MCFTNLNAFHEIGEQGIEPADALPNLGPRIAKMCLGDCCRDEKGNYAGKIHPHRLHGAGARGEDIIVAVKKEPEHLFFQCRGCEPNERDLHQQCLFRPFEDGLNEGGVYVHLSRQGDTCRHILKMHKILRCEDEIWLVLEYANGVDVLTQLRGAPVHGTKLKQWMIQALEGLVYLKSKNIAHRDLSVENLFILDDELKLADFGQAVLITSSDGSPNRCFRAVGKLRDRAPECVIPVAETVTVRLPEEAPKGHVLFTEVLSRGRSYTCEVELLEDAKPGRECLAKPCGYRPDRSDIYNMGHAFLLMWTKRPADHAFVCRRGLEAWVLQSNLRLPAPLMELLKAMMQGDPNKRPTAEDCLDFAFFH